MELLEEAMKVAVNETVRERFHPYYQLHEFEGLLFNDINVFTSQIPADDLVDVAELDSLIKEHPNPELINDTPDNAPSHRLKRLIKGYNKVVYGAILAEEIGLEKIRKKSLRFNQWIDK